MTVTEPPVSPMPQRDPTSDRIAEGARALDLDAPPELCAALARYAALLLRWNERVNLLARGVGPDEIVERHLLDSLALLRLVRPTGHLLDVGSGAGLPGVPLRLAAPGASVTLLEPRAKRAAFLRTAARELSLPDLAVREGRLEGLAPDERFELLVSRATFAPSEWVGRAAPLRAAGGRVVVMLADADPAPIRAAAAAQGLAVVAEDAFTLPWSGAPRRNLLLA